MDALKGLPSVDQVLRSLMQTSGLPHEVVVAEIRAVLGEQRERVKAGGAAMPIEPIVEERLRALAKPSLRGVINATGVVLHTNLGRAPLMAFQPLAGYSNLEYDLAAGKRGKRDAHTAHLLERLIGRPAILVNNNAAAVFLVLHELAAGQEVIVSRGELIEIGDGFRIPEIMARSGAVLKEVGTTNRTSLNDYREAINAKTRLIMRVHPSNFRVTGFTARPSLKELVDLGRSAGIPVYEDLGCGYVVDLGLKEPMAQASLAAGASLISFSGDKLLGGPQAGIIAGDSELVGRMRRNPLFRALRQDKLVYRALEKTLRNIVTGCLDEVPALRMIRMPAEAIRVRAERLAGLIPGAAVEAGESVIGGGSTPDITLPTWVISVEADEKKLRAGNPPIVARVENDRVLLDLRTVLPEEEAALVQALS